MWIDMVPVTAAPAQKEVKKINAFSSFVPLAQGAIAFPFKLILDNQDAVDVGIEAGGLPKVFGQLTLPGPQDPNTPFLVKEGKGDAAPWVVRGQLQQGFTDTDRNTFYSGLAAAFGLQALPAPDSPYTDWIATYFDADPTRQECTDGKNDSPPVQTLYAKIKAPNLVQVPYDKAKDRIDINPRSHLGATLRGLGFKTTLVGYGANALLECQSQPFKPTAQ